MKTEAQDSTAVEEEEFVIKRKAAPQIIIKDGKKKLVRARGKRGGVKNQKKPLSSTGRRVKKAGAADKGPSEHSLRIAKFHTLEKAIAQSTDEQEVLKLKEEQAALGGLEAYQEDSLKGGDKLKGGESGKWLAEQLAPLFPNKDTKPVRLLDVGAIAGTSYDKFPWVDCTGIDLNPRADKVQKYDFFDYPKPTSAEDKFDVVALSLVINFVGDLKKRGEMLLHAHSYLRPSGYLYLVLPVACVTNSRYLTHDHLRAILSSCGYDVVTQNDSKRLTRWLLKRKQKKNAAKWDGKTYKKTEQLKGGHRNNFAICLGE